MVETMRGERWEDFRDRYGDWGRDAVLSLGRNLCGMKLRELGDLAGGVDDATVGMAVKRFEEKLERNTGLRVKMDEMERRFREGMMQNGEAKTA